MFYLPLIYATLFFDQFLQARLYLVLGMLGKRVMIPAVGESASKRLTTL